MQTLTESPPARRTYSRPREGFTTPATARKAAEIYLAGGHTAAAIRRDHHPEDMLFAELADAMDELASVPAAA